jgi:hypothetical protein
MKVCLLGDTHFGMRGDSIPFLDYGEKFYDETFFPYLVDNGINYIIQLKCELGLFQVLIIFTRCFIKIKLKLYQT